MPPAWTERAQSSSAHGSAGGLPGWAKRSRILKRPSSAARPSLAKHRCKPRTWTPDTLLGLLEHAGLPSWWKDLLATSIAEALACPLLVGLEIFSGCEALSEAFRKYAGPFASFDNISDPSNDILSWAGLKRLAVWILSIGKHGYIHLGTPCKSWV